MTHVMDELLSSKDGSSALVTFLPGQTVKGEILDITPSRILLELPGGNTGIITKKETSKYDALDELEKGQALESIVLDPENDSGLVVLSLRRASIDTAWAELNKMFEESRIFKVRIEEANKGGLMAQYKGLKAFLPVSQLTPLHYPRVPDGSGSAILSRLQEHVGSDFAVRLINVDREEGRIIISEKAAHDEQIEQTLANVNEGDVAEGVVSGVMKFGIFVTFGGVEGLVHLSELDWAHVSNPAKRYNIGDKVEVLVIGKDGDKLSFSIKRLKEDPWKKLVTDVTEGDKVKGRVNRWNQNGVFIEVKPEVQGLFSLDQFGVEKHSDLKISEGQEMEGEVVEINYNSHRLELKLVGDAAKAAPKKEEKTETPTEEVSEEAEK